MGFSTLTYSSVARADVPPPNACDSEGSSCQTAGSDYDQPGTCSKKTCSRATPDGTMEYECLLCAGGASGSESGEGSGTSDDDDGCAVASAPRSPWSNVALVAAGLGMALVGRRRFARS